MKRVKVTALMCEEDSGGFTTGIGKIGDYSEAEFANYKYHELTAGIDLINGCCWSYSFDWYN